MLWAMMKAAAEITYAAYDAGAQRKVEDRMAVTRDRKLLHQEEFAEAVKAEADALNLTPAKSPNFVLAVAPGLKERLKLKSQPGRDKIFTAVDLIRSCKREGGN